MFHIHDSMHSVTDYLWSMRDKGCVVDKKLLKFDNPHCLSDYILSLVAIRPEIVSIMNNLLLATTLARILWMLRLESIVVQLKQPLHRWH